MERHNYLWFDIIKDINSYMRNGTLVDNIYFYMVTYNNATELLNWIKKTSALKLHEILLTKDTAITHIKIQFDEIHG